MRDVSGQAPESPSPLGEGLGWSSESSPKPDLGTRAKEMRRQPTTLETILWRHLSNSKIGGFKFRRQSVIEPYIVDFLCPSKALVVEIDGHSHDAKRDAARGAYLAAKGNVTVRFTNAQIRDETEGVLTAILAQLNTMPDRWPDRLPHPNPSPKGKGLL